MHLELCGISVSGSSGGYKYNMVPGFPFTQLPWNSNAPGFQRIDLDRYIWSVKNFLCVDKISNLDM